jgi:nucleoside-diphosphate-sugar epimerase
VLVTGAEGYIGAILLPYLAARGIEVTGLDTGYYRDGWLYSDNEERPRSPTIIYKDLRRCTQEDVAGFDAIVHLAELSNDPLGENRPEITRQINYGGSVHLAQLAQRAGIQRFVYTSSCSAYGLGTGEILDETSPTRPQTEYARCKIMVEEALGAMAAKDFCPVFLRNATAYGASPRMRFDIVLNDLSALAWTTKQIKMISDGTPWRPLVHVADICEAIRCALLAPAERVSGQIMNVGADKENYRVREIAEIVASEFPGCQVSFGGASSDNRSYRVAFAKIRKQLPDFECSWSARDGARQLHTLFERLQMPKETYEFRAFTRLKQLKYLQATQQIDEAFFWRPR